MNADEFRRQFNQAFVDASRRRKVRTVYAPLYGIEAYPREQLKLAMLVAAGLKQDLILLEPPHDA